MAKNKRSEITPEEAIQFLEDIRNLSYNIDEPTVAISLRVPANILRALKLKAKAEKKKYQSIMIECLRQGLRGYENYFEFNYLARAIFFVAVFGGPGSFSSMSRQIYSFKLLIPFC